jgi:hypothetical protein
VLLCSGKRLKAGFGLAEAGEADIAAEDSHGFKERRRVFTSADRDPDGLEGLPGLQTQVRSGSTKRLIERIVIEAGGSENLLRVLEDAECEIRIALLRDQVGWVVGGELGQEEEVGG